jgi:hypothetical protein
MIPSTSTVTDTKPTAPTFDFSSAVNGVGANTPLDKANLPAISWRECMLEGNKAGVEATPARHVQSGLMKFGSGVLIDDSGAVVFGLLKGVANDIAHFRTQGIKSFIIFTSGFIAEGYEQLKHLPEFQGLDLGTVKRDHPLLMTRCYEAGGLKLVADWKRAFREVDQSGAKQDIGVELFRLKGSDFYLHPKGDGSFEIRMQPKAADALRRNMDLGIVCLCNGDDVSVSEATSEGRKVPEQIRKLVKNNDSLTNFIATNVLPDRIGPIAFFMDHPGVLLLGQQTAAEVLTPAELTPEVMEAFSNIAPSAKGSGGIYYKVLDARGVGEKFGMAYVGAGYYSFPAGTPPPAELAGIEPIRVNKFVASEDNPDVKVLKPFDQYPAFRQIFETISLSPTSSRDPLGLDLNVLPGVSKGEAQLPLPGTIMACRLMDIKTREGISDRKPGSAQVEIFEPPAPR